MALPNTPAPLVEAAATNPIESALDAILGVLPDLIGRVESIERGGVSNIPNTAVQGFGVLADIETLFGHLGLGKPKSATPPSDDPATGSFG